MLLKKLKIPISKSGFPKKCYSGLPYLRKLSIDDFKISPILFPRVLKYGNLSQKFRKRNTKTFSFQASCALTMTEVEKNKRPKMRMRRRRRETRDGWIACSLIRTSSECYPGDWSGLKVGWMLLMKLYSLNSSDSVWCGVWIIILALIPWSRLYDFLQ